MTSRPPLEEVPPMILLGLLLMAACAALAVDAVVQNTSVMHAIAFNQPISHLSLGAIFVDGAVVGLLFALGLLMFTGGIGRAVRQRRERRSARGQAAAGPGARAVSVVSPGARRPRRRRRCVSTTNGWPLTLSRRAPAPHTPQTSPI